MSPELSNPTKRSSVPPSRLICPKALPSRIFELAVLSCAAAISFSWKPKLQKHARHIGRYANKGGPWEWMNLYETWHCYDVVVGQARSKRQVDDFIFATPSRKQRTNIFHRLNCLQGLRSLTSNIQPQQVRRGAWRHGRRFFIVCP